MAAVTELAEPRYAGEESFGLTAEERKRIVQMVNSTKGHVRIDVSAHGEPGRPPRDAIMLRVVS